MPQQKTLDLLIADQATEMLGQLGIVPAQRAKNTLKAPGAKAEGLQVRELV